MISPLRHVLETIRSAQRPPIVCIGDLMLDRYVYGSVSRISPEAPIPVLKRQRLLAMPGATANVARNAAALGGQIGLYGIIGDDVAGTELEQELQVQENMSSALVRLDSAQTIIKTRFVAGSQQVLRVDEEGTPDDWSGGVDSLIAAIDADLGDAKAVLVSDYAKGVVTRELMQSVVSLAKARKVPVLVDPKVPDWSIYGAVDLIKPNVAELAQATGLPAGTDEEVETALCEAMSRFSVDNILVTRADKGVAHISRDGAVEFHRGEPVEVYDVSGAGDTTLAALGVAMASGVDLSSAAIFATAASRIAVTKRGTAVVHLDEVADRVAAVSPQTPGSYALSGVMARVETWRRKGQKVGFTNGCFDILHVGHLKVIEEAKARCDRLVVGLNSNASVRRLKGAERPVNGEHDRARLLEGLSAVDAVVIFDDDTPLELIQALAPDVLVKGGDYTPDTIVGYDETVARGGEVHIVPLVKGRSTTSTIRKLRDN